MKEIIIKGQKQYFTYIDSNMDKLPYIFYENKIRKEDGLFIITDSNVYNMYKKNIMHYEDTFGCNTFIFEAGEKSKNINTVQLIYDFLLVNGCNRKSLVIALGGGVVGDLTGFAASTFMRGVRYINIPTTLISQCDSCIGGKVGYNYNDVKNLIGNFYNPEFTFVSTSFLQTLTEQDYLSGLGEVVKYGAIKDKAILSYIEQNQKQIRERENDRLQHITRECLRIKSEIVHEDFRDEGIRNVLNFGHTVGHGLEIISNYQLCHGKAVALGILTAVKLSYDIFKYDDDTYERLIKIYNNIGLPTEYKIHEYDKFFNVLSHDKKNTMGLNFVLIDENGICKTKVKVTREQVVKALQQSIDRGK